MDPPTILADEGFMVPRVAPAESGVAWLRGAVARFSEGADHARRRAYVVAELARVDPDSLRRRAGGRTPVDVLSEAIGAHGVTVDDVAAVAASYHPHTTITPEADAAVARLVEACGGTADERTAARIGLLVQAHAATTGLIDNARARPRAGTSVDEHLAETLRQDPPVRQTRRVDPSSGDELVISLADVPFGAGAHACPGRAHAIAIAAGVLEGRREEDAGVEDARRI